MTHLPQIAIAVWLLALVGTMLWVARDPKTLYLYPAQVRRVALYTIAGAIGEAVTLAAGGFFG